MKKRKIAMLVMTGVLLTGCIDVYKRQEYGLVEVIHQVVEKRIPFLGICLGLQLLFEKSDESEGVKGLIITRINNYNTSFTI